jgi:hypothetical protein
MQRWLRSMKPHAVVTSIDATFTTSDVINIEQSHLKMKSYFLAAGIDPERYLILGHQSNNSWSKKP